MMDIKIVITGTLIDHDKADLEKKLEALVMDFLGEHINPIAEYTEPVKYGEPMTHYSINVK